MKPTSSEQPVVLTDGLSKRLAAYALCAGVAGVGVMASATPAAARVVFTPVNVSIAPGTTYNVDLDGDGTTDFQFGNIPFGFFGAFLSVKFNSIVNDPSANEPAALPGGANINSSRRFLSCGNCSPYGLVMIDVNSSSHFGQWYNVANHYLGLKFQINGETHFGWARLSVRVKSRSIVARLSGYAYETTPNKAIRAGQTSDNDSRASGSLGNLARGAQK